MRLLQKCVVISYLLHKKYFGIEKCVEISFLLHTEYFNVEKSATKKIRGSQNKNLFRIYVYANVRA